MFTDPFGLKACPGIEGTDQDNLDDCPEGSPEWYAARVAKGEGSKVLNHVGGLLSSLARVASDHTTASATVGYKTTTGDAHAIVSGGQNGLVSHDVTISAVPIPQLGASVGVVIGNPDVAASVDWGLGKHLGISFNFDRQGRSSGFTLHVGIATPIFPVSASSPQW